MSSTLSSEDFGLKIYNRFPPKYREDDSTQRYALKRYLESASDGGFKYVIDDTNGLLDLINPDREKSEVLPLLFKQYGLEVFNGIPEAYLRYVLPKLGELWSKKGAIEALEFLTSSISGVKTVTDVIYDDYGNPFIDIRLEMDYNIGDYIPDTAQFKRLIKNFIPFYVDYELIYSYLFVEFGNLTLKDDQIDQMTITYTLEDQIGLYSKGVKAIYDKESVFNEFKFNELPFGTYNKDLSADFKDTIKEVLSESQRFATIPDYSFTNDTYSTLNGELFTNCLDYIDTITYVG